MFRTTRPPPDLVTLPSGHKVPASSLRSLDSVPRSQPLFEKLPAVPGSIAGANSRFLTEYKKHAEKEKRRVAVMERDEIQEKDREEFDAKRLERQRALDDEAARKRERRQKRKVSKSSGGLPLPVDVVRKIMEEEANDISSHAEVRETRTHPYAINPSGLSKTISKSKDILPQISIVDEDDN